MKTLFVIFVAFLLTFFIGCQDLVSDPEMTENIAGENVNKDFVSTWPGYIELNGSLFDQLHPNFDVQIAGVVKYKIDPVDQIDANNIKVHIYVTAEMKSFCPNQNGPWKVFGITEDILYSSTKILEKSFEVKNTRNCHYKLVLRFMVREEKLILISKELRPYGKMYADKSEF